MTITPSSHQSRQFFLVIVALCAALNLAVGSIVFLVKLPIYLDMIGTMLCGLLLANRPMRAFLGAAAAGVVSFLAGGLLNPYLPWFTLTVVAVAALMAFVVSGSAQVLRTASFETASFWVRVIAYGVLLGIVAAIISAPVVTFLFGGITGSGTALLVAFFLKTGNQLLNAAVLSGLTAEPIDKSIQFLFAVMLYRATPQSVIARLDQ